MGWFKRAVILQGPEKCNESIDTGRMCRRCSDLSNHSAHCVLEYLNDSLNLTVIYNASRLNSRILPLTETVYVEIRTGVLLHCRVVALHQAKGRRAVGFTKLPVNDEEGLLASGDRSHHPGLKTDVSEKCCLRHQSRCRLLMGAFRVLAYCFRNSGTHLQATIYIFTVVKTSDLMSFICFFIS